MRKAAVRNSTVYMFVQRTDLVLTRAAGDLLVTILRARCWLEAQSKLPAFRRTLIDYSAVAAAAFAFGSFMAVVLFVSR